MDYLGYQWNSTAIGSGYVMRWATCGSHSGLLWQVNYVKY